MLHTTLHCRKSGWCDFFSGQKGFYFLSLCYDFKAFGYAFTRPNGNAERCMKHIVQPTIIH
jgi:hypothetical protein